MAQTAYVLPLQQIWRVMKQQLKSIANLVFSLVSWPVYLVYLLGKKRLGERKAFAGAAQLCSLMPGVTGEWFRRGFLQWVTKLPLQDACICFGSTFSDPRLQIEDGVYIGPRCDIGYAHIGRDCVLGSAVHILSGQHQHYFADPEQPIRDQAGEFRQVVVGQNTWIGNCAIIASDVGSGCVIGAGSVVVKPLPDRAVAAGNPAHILRYR